jgi:hypothetical protein
MDNTTSGEGIPRATGFIDTPDTLDPRNWNYPIPPSATPPASIRWYRPSGVVLDQGEYGACSAFGSYGCVIDTPILEHSSHSGSAKPDASDAEALTLYYDAAYMDGRTDPLDITAGVSMQSCAAILKNDRKWISRYEWAFNWEQFLSSFSRGPIYGAFMTTSFLDVDASGHAHGGESTETAHAVVFDELDVENERIWFTNSWGTWGIDGRAWFTYAELESRLYGGDIKIAMCQLIPNGYTLTSGADYDRLYPNTYNGSLSTTLPGFQTISYTPTSSTNLAWVRLSLNMLIHNGSAWVSTAICPAVTSSFTVPSTGYSTSVYTTIPIPIEMVFSATSPLLTYTIDYWMDDNPSTIKSNTFNQYDTTYTSFSVGNLYSKTYFAIVRGVNTWAIGLSHGADTYLDRYSVISTPPKLVVGHTSGNGIFSDSTLRLHLEDTTRSIFPLTIHSDEGGRLGFVGTGSSLTGVFYLSSGLLSATNNTVDSSEEYSDVSFPKLWGRLRGGTWVSMGDVSLDYGIHEMTQSVPYGCKSVDLSIHTSRIHPPTTNYSSFTLLTGYLAQGHTATIHVVCGYSVDEFDITNAYLFFPVADPSFVSVSV